MNELQLFNTQVTFDVLLFWLLYYYMNNFPIHLNLLSTCIISTIYFNLLLIPIIYCIIFKIYITKVFYYNNYIILYS